MDIFAEIFMVITDIVDFVIGINSNKSHKKKAVLRRRSN